MDRSLTYPRSNFYESVVPHPEFNEFARRLGYRVDNPMVAALTSRVTRRDFGSVLAAAVGGQHRSGHERRLVGGEEDTACGDPTVTPCPGGKFCRGPVDGGAWQMSPCGA
jgi:hypothetical protein